MRKTVSEENIVVTTSPLRFFWMISKPYRWWALLATGIVLAAASSGVYLRVMIEGLVNSIESNDHALAMFTFLLYPVVFFSQSALWRLSGVTASLWLLGVPKSTKDMLAAYVSQHSHGYFSNRFAGSLSNKINNVSNAMEDFVATFLWSFLENIVPLVITAVIFWQTDTMVGVAFVVMIVVALVLNILLMPRKRRLSRAVADAQSKTTGFVVDMVSNISAVRQYVRTEEELQRVDDLTSEVRSKGLRSFWYSEYMMLVNSLVFAVFTVIMFLLLSDKWLAGEITSGRLISFVLLLTYVSGTVVFLGRIVSHVAKLYGQAEEGLQEIIQPFEVSDAADASDLVVPKADIAFAAVDFAYEQDDTQTVFKQLEINIPAGQRVGLVGPSGAGKSTLVSLLLRQHDVTGGAILIADQNIASVTQASLRRQIAVVPQEPLLFHRSIRENIMYGQPAATEAEMIAVAKKAQAHDFISALPEGYDTLVGERGVKLSGGQKQRVAIARAMLKSAPILVLDEATSALDSESEVAIQQALEEIMKDKTVIAVAHRLSTLRKMDRILVIVDGKIVQDGTHEELSQQDGMYKNLWDHQAGGFLQE